MSTFAYLLGVVPILLAVFVGVLCVGRAAAIGDRIYTEADVQRRATPHTGNVTRLFDGNVDA